MVGTEAAADAGSRRWRALLNEAQINVLASYVWGLSNKAAK